MFIDIHSHLVPCVDDGAKTLQESLDMLASMKMQGVEKAVITPHLNSDYIKMKGLDRSKSEIEENFTLLTENISAWQGMFPELFLASEYFLDIRKQKDGIDPIPMPDGRHVLLELPYDADLGMVKRSTELVRDCGFKVILAHPEKYDAFLEYEREESFDWLSDNPEILVQTECNYLCEGNSDAWEFVNRRLTAFIGTDSHGYKRPPLFGDTRKALGSWAGMDRERTEYAEKLTGGNAQKLFPEKEQ